MAAVHYRCSHHLPMVKPDVLILILTIIFTIITIICTIIVIICIIITIIIIIITTMITCSWSSPVFSAISSHSGFASPSPISLSLVQALKNKKSIFLTAVSQLLIESLKAFKTETHPSPNIPSLQIIQLACIEENLKMLFFCWYLVEKYKEDQKNALWKIFNLAQNFNLCLRTKTKMT